MYLCLRVWIYMDHLQGDTLIKELNFDFFFSLAHLLLLLSFPYFVYSQIYQARIILYRQLLCCNGEAWITWKGSTETVAVHTTLGYAYTTMMDTLFFLSVTSPPPCIAILDPVIKHHQ